MRLAAGQLKSIVYEVLPFFIVGLLMPISFAPFHLSGLAYISLALLLVQLNKSTHHFVNGFAYGMAFFGFGISWVFNSIHQFGHLPIILSLLITASFVSFLALYPALTLWIYKKLEKSLTSPIYHSALFASLWTLSEWLRGHLFTGFPWLQLGFSQLDSPLKKLIPVFGVYGTTFLVAFIAGLIASLIIYRAIKRMIVQIFIVLFFLILYLWSPTLWTKIHNKPLSVGIVQANLSMKDKWDESYFWHLLTYYQNAIYTLLGKDLIILPESAIPVPSEIIQDEINAFDSVSKLSGSAILLGIPFEEAKNKQQHYYNSLTVLGNGNGIYRKQQLVPFGEYLPKPFHFLSNWEPVAGANILPGTSMQPLPKVKERPFATLICYELAFDHLLINQLPDAQWLVSISDDGWFGYSLAPFQQRQIAQVRSLQTGRYQVLANNDGLSAVIDPRGTIIAALPAFTSGILTNVIYPATGMTPWTCLGNKPIISVCLIIAFASLINRISRYWELTYKCQQARMI